MTCRDNLIIVHKDEQYKWGHSLISMNSAKLILNLWTTFSCTDAEVAVNLSWLVKWS